MNEIRLDEGVTSPWPRAIAAARSAFREHLEFLPLLRALVRRDIAVRYRNSVLGFGWAVGMPLMNMLIFTVIFTRLVPLDTAVPYPIYAYTGLLAWNLFASSLRFAALSLVANTYLVTKVYFARETLPLSAVLVALFDFAAAFVVLAGLMFWFDVPVGWTVLLMPLILLVQLALTSGLALLVAMATLFYPDVKYVLELVLMVGMFATAVVVPIERLGGTLGTVMGANPMTQIINAYRAVLLRGELPDPVALTSAGLVAVVTLFGGFLLFHRAEFRFAEEI